MALNDKHKDYVAMAPKWQRCRDVSAGQDSIHAAGEAYLPKLKDQTQEDYAAYVKRATFYNATWRTIAGLLGMLFRKSPDLEVPVGLEDHISDVTMSGVPFQIFAQQIAEECMVVGRVGVFVDYPVVDTETMTEADVLALNLRPSMNIYKAESIINWRCRRVNNKYVLSQVVLKEVHSEQVDEFTDGKPEDRYRVLDLVDVASGESVRTVYRIRLFKLDERGNPIQIGVDSIPQMNGDPLAFIPFYFIGVDDTTPDVDEPPLIDLVDINLSHYLTMADWEHGAHFTGLPTPVVSGYSPPNNDGEAPDKLYIGSTTAWVFTDPLAKAAYLEFTGQGLGTLKDLCERKELMMAILGARMLEVQKKGVESADAAGIHRSGEQATLASAAQAISMGLAQALQTFSEWAGMSGGVKFSLNREFMPTQMDAEKLTALIMGWQKGAYSYDTLFSNLKQGEVISIEATPESEQAKMKSGAPVAADPSASVPSAAS
jgi:hypothetical protein